MALINENDNYIKVIKDGWYYIYASEEEREKEKNAVRSSVVLQWYANKIAELIADTERQYYDEENWNREFQAVDSERRLYEYNLANYITTGSYPVIAKVYPDVEDSIPEIIQMGSLMVESETAEEEYELVKEREYFGETEDA